MILLILSALKRQTKAFDPLGKAGWIDPKDEVERCDRGSLSISETGARAKSGRITYGSLIFQEYLSAANKVL